MDIKSKKLSGSNNQMQARNNNILYRLERKITKLMHIISMVSVAPCVVALIGWVFLITVYVVGRNFFNLQWVFVEETTGYIMVLIGYLSQAYVLKVGGHTSLTFVFEQLPNKIQSILELITGFLAFTLVCYLIWRSAQFFIWQLFENKG